MTNPVFIVKTGFSTSSNKGETIQADRIDFTYTPHSELIRDFTVKGLSSFEKDYYLPQVEHVLMEEKDFVQLPNNKFVVRCKVESNRMLQIYEIVKTIKESNHNSNVKSATNHNNHLSYGAM